jgi:hypothetical protein
MSCHADVPRAPQARRAVEAGAAAQTVPCKHTTSFNKFP